MFLFDCLKASNFKSEKPIGGVHLTPLGCLRVNDIELKFGWVVVNHEAIRSL